MSTHHLLMHEQEMGGIPSEALDWHAEHSETIPWELDETLLKEYQPGEVGEVAVFPEEQASVVSARKLLRSVDADKEIALFAPHLATIDLLDETEQLTLAIGIHFFVQRHGEQKFADVVRAFEPGGLKAFLIDYWDNPLPEQEMAAMLKDPILFANAYASLRKLKGAGTSNEVHAQMTAAIGDAREADALVKDIVAPFIEKVEEGEDYVDFDETDYRVPVDIAPELPKTARAEHIFAFGKALRDYDGSACLAVVEAAIGGKLSEEESKAAADAVARVVQQRARMDEHYKEAPVIDVPSQDEIQVYHAGFKRTRRIAPFEKILAEKMAGPWLAFVIRAVKDKVVYGDVNATLKAARSGMKLYGESLKLYKDVVEKGVPVFREFAGYLAEHAKEGQFHVGRDTHATTFVAANAQAWGNMSAQERAAAIRHVDVSRSVVTNTPRALLLGFLEQEKVNQQMMGVDGGLKGSSPAEVLLTINPSLTKEDLDQKIRLIVTHKEYQQRRFNPARDQESFLVWMETLPKFTERANRIKKSANEFGKYYVVTKRRSEGERLLAWTVQHAVWRELIPKGVQEKKTGPR